MKTARTGKAVLPRRTLTQLAGAGETGALHVEGEPGGIVYLTDGWVSYVESPASPGVGELLTTSGRLPGQVWEAAAASGDEVGPLLVAQGHLTQGELELCTLGAIYDAAFFVLSPAPVRVRFGAGERHPLGPVCQVDAGVLGRELTRRRRLLDDAHPSSDVDTGPLVAVPRAPVPRLVLSGAQWELIVHCDGQRSATDLARLVGRAGYTTLLELRRLAAAGLVTAAPPDEPQAAAPPGTGKPPEPKAGTAAGTEKPAEPKAGATPGPTAKPSPPVPRRATNSRRAVAAGGGGRTNQTEARLPRRTPGQQPSGPDPPPAFRDELDEALLTRIRSGLEAL
ncbi:ADAM 12 protein [Phytohabitans sp. ZYX-F-186]|uniref:ADAM 12 protein n=1 Tax=Phytohabitans maris TaxID=3071409 RepID=A0ABU0Z7F5_9ACTN|nr:ADAM 12 protein [Phytohabitans sp. ZYX-F-186]MDQ7902986.1 ADAM 12 protein [Phytohabitans sp. ZYX-F-186]